MKINEYQKLAMTTLNKDLNNKDVLINAVMGLCGEAGEAIDIVKKHLHQGHELDKDKLITKKSLGELPLVLLPFDASNRKNFNKFCSSNNIIIHPLMEIGNDLIIEDCAKSGLGVGLVVREYVQSKLDNQELFELKTNFTLKEKDLVCLIETNRKNNIIIKNFVELLK